MNPFENARLSIGRDCPTVKMGLFLITVFDASKHASGIAREANGLYPLYETDDGPFLDRSVGIEGVASVPESASDGRVPPTSDLENPDEGCDLDYVPQQRREHNVGVALSTPSSFAATTKHCFSKSAVIEVVC